MLCYFLYINWVEEHNLDILFLPYLTISGLHDKNKCLSHMKNLKKPLNLG